MATRVNLSVASTSGLRSVGHKRVVRTTHAVKQARAVSETKTRDVSTCAVMAPVATEKESRRSLGERRGGMGRRFADEESLDSPGEDAGIRNFWYPVHFEAKLAKFEQDKSDVFTLFGEKFRLVRADAGGIEVATRAIASLWGGADGVAASDDTSDDKQNANSNPKRFAATDDAFVCVSCDGTGRYYPIGCQDGLVMVWPGTCRPVSQLPKSFKPPEGYTTHAELIIECVPVEHGLLMENLLDLAHAPFTHTGTFAKGWGVPNFVEFVSKQMRKPGDGWVDMATSLANVDSGKLLKSYKKTTGMNGELEGQQGSWNPYPIDMKFVTPCMVDSHIGMSQAGAAGGGAQFEEGVQCAECSNHLHQLHVCAPAEAGTTRLLYRMSLDFAGWAKYVPGIELVWTEMANQVLGEDLRLVTGQQDRMARGGRVWAHPVAYDKLGLVYRRWRNFSAGEACPLPAGKE